MSFDAGAIVATMRIDLTQFDRDATTVETRIARIRKAASEPIRIGVQVDQQQLNKARRDFASLDQQLTRDASRRAGSGGGSLLGSLLGSMVGSHGASSAAKNAAQAEERQTNAFLRLLSHGIGGSIPGGGGGHQVLQGGQARLLGGLLRFSLQGKTLSGIGLGGSLLGAVPALGALGAGLGVVGGGAVAAISGSKALQTQGKTVLDDLKKTFQNAAEPLVKPLEQAFGQIPKFLAGIAPELKSLFGAAAPLLKPLLSGLEALVKGLLPGLVTILKAAAPVFHVFAGLLGSLGGALGKMFKDFAPVLKQSSTIFKALADVVGSLLPIIGHLGAIFAKTLAPIFVVVTGIIKQLEPVLIIVGKVIAQLAKAVLESFAGALQAVATLLKDISPSLNILAKALGQVFELMENSGVFGVLEDALEKLAPLLAKLINSFVRGLAPILPVIFKLIDSLAGTAINLLVTAVQALMPVALALINSVLKPLLPVISALVPVITEVAKLFADGLGTVLQFIAPLLVKLAPVIVGIVAAIKLWSIAMGILDTVLDANPIGLITIAVAALVLGIIELVKHWNTVWGEIKKVASDAWNFIWNGFGKYLLPLLGPAGLIALGVIELVKHWRQIFGDLKQWIYTDFIQKIGDFFTQTIPNIWDSAIRGLDNHLITPLKNGLSDAVTWVHDHFVTPIANFVTQTIPNAFEAGVRAIGRAWDDIEGAVKAPVNWVITHVINNGLINAFDWISGKVGGPHINHVPTLAAGGRVTAGTGSITDDVLARISHNETVVSAEHSKLLAPLFGMIGVPGYARGGVPHLDPATSKSGQPASGIWHDITSLFGKTVDIGKILAAIATGNGAALGSDILKLVGGTSGSGAAPALASLLADIPKSLVKDVVHFLLGHFGSSPVIGGGSGSAIARYASQYATGLSHPYVLGGQSPAGWDCSGFSAWIYEHFGYFPGRQKSRYGTSETQFASSLLQPSGPQAGALVFFDDGIFANPGHVGVMINGTSYAGADSPAVGTIISSAAGAVGYRVPRGGFKGSTNRLIGHDNGGWLHPGAEMSFNGTGQREAVLTPGQSQAFVDLADAARHFARGAGQTGTSALMRDVYLTLPEGATVAQALAELTFRLRMHSLTTQAGTP